MKKIKIVNITSFLMIIYFVVTKIIYYAPGLGSIKEVYLHNLIDISGTIGLVLNISIAIWLFIETKQKKQSPYIWVVLALFFGLIAVFTYYWRIIYIELIHKKQ